jgi:hypothetical protein
VQVEIDALVCGDLNACEHAPVIGAVIAIVKQSDVPLRADGVQELQQRTGALREFKPE